MKLAYSYIRFSTPAQKTGDSLRRQTEARDDWLKVHPDVKLDTALRMTDEGISARHGKNRSDKACLGAFLSLVEGNRIPRGSYLLVENLDRLSRQDVHEGLYLLLGLIRKGIHVVQLMPVVTEFADTGEDLSMKLMIAIMELRRGNSESVMKENRLGKVWAEKREQAGRGKVVGKEGKGAHRFPGWVTREGEALTTNEHSKTVKRLFELLLAGYGCAAIAKRFNEDKVPTFGTRPYWGGSTLYSIATSRAVLGEYQPRTEHNTEGKRVKVGEPVIGFYPAVIDEATWLKAQQLIKGRGGRKGKSGGRTGRVNLFRGLVHDGVSGSAFHLNCGTRSNLMEPYFHRGARHSGPCSASFPVEVFELAMIREMGNLNLADLLPHQPVTNEVEILSAERTHIEGQLVEAEQEILRGEAVSRWSSLVNKLSQRLATVNTQLDEAKLKDANPMTEVVGEVTGLLKAIGEQPPLDTRKRLQTAINRLIRGIWCVVRPDGVRRVLLAQIKFHGGVPDYLVSVVYTRAGQGRGWTRPMSWESARFMGTKTDLEVRSQALFWYNTTTGTDEDEFKSCTLSDQELLALTEKPDGMPEETWRLHQTPEVRQFLNLLIES